MINIKIFELKFEFFRNININNLDKINEIL